jgi:chromate transporter
MNTSKKERIKSTILEYLDLFWTMFKIGICTFGGGYAMMAIIEKELAEKRQWATSEELVDYMAIAQITPGVIAVNISTFIGRKRKGILGGIIATLGVIAPSIIIIMIIAAFLVNFQENEYVQHALAGIRVCVCVLIFNAVISFIKKTVIDLLSLVAFICVFILAAFTRIETVYLTLGVIAISVVLTLIFGGKYINADKKFGADKEARK